MTMSATTAPVRATHSHRRSTAHPFLSVVARAVSDRIGLALVVGVLMVGMGLLVGALWPSLQGTFADLEESLPQAFTTILGGVSLGSPVGWANAEMISLVAPLGGIAVAVVSATRATAGEEEAKTMGVLLSTPLTRVEFLLAKTVAMVVHVAIVGVAVCFGLLLGDVVGDMGMANQGMLGASAHVVLISLLFGAVAILVGAATGNRRVTTGTAAGLAVIAFAAASFLPLSESLADGAKASPWYYFNDSVPLANGVEWTHLLVLAVATVVLIGASLPVFRARDLRG